MCGCCVTGTHRGNMGEGDRLELGTTRSGDDRCRLTGGHHLTDKYNKEKVRRKKGAHGGGGGGGEGLCIHGAAAQGILSPSLLRRDRDSQQPPGASPAAATEEDVPHTGAARGGSRLHKPNLGEGAGGRRETDCQLGVPGNKTLAPFCLPVSCRAVLPIIRLPPQVPGNLCKGRGTGRRG